MRTLGQLISIALGVSISLAEAAAVVHPQPTGIAPSKHYRVRVDTSVGRQSSFVYQSDSRHKHSLGRSTSWTSLVCREPLTVRVEPIGRQFATCRILPSSLGIETRKVGSQAVFAIPRPCQISVEFDDDITHALLIFADPPEVDVPTADDEDVIYFGPGRHELTEPIVLRSGQTLYLAGGAYVCGHVVGPAAKEAWIRGRGVLSGELLPNPATHKMPTDYAQLLKTIPALIHFRHMPLGDGKWDGSWKCHVEGITLVDAPRDNLVFDGGWCNARWVKFISWFFRTDGVMGGKHLTIEDCFFKVNDDAVKLYKQRTTARRCTIWQMENGAPFQFGWNNNRNQRGFLVEDCDVIRTEHFWKTNQNAVFAALHAGSGHLGDYTFRDIRVENVTHRLFNLTMDANKFATNTQRGSICDVLFEDITVRGTPRLPNCIRGHDSQHQIANVHFRNLVIDGQPITDAEQGRFDIHGRTTTDIRFSADRERP